MTTCNQVSTRTRRRIHSLSRCYLDQALAAGELLANKKRQLRHGQFTDWLRETQPYSPRTAQRYLRLYAFRREIAAAGCRNIHEAYDLIDDLMGRQVDPQAA